MAEKQDFQPVFHKTLRLQNALSRIPKKHKVSPNVFTTDMDWPGNTLSQNVMLEVGKSLKTVLKIQSEEISLRPKKKQLPPRT